MGKGWKGSNSKQEGKKGGGFAHDFSSCRGFGVIIATCDGAKERETSRELVNLVNDAIERIYPESLNSAPEGEGLPNAGSDSKENPSSLSISELMKREINSAKNKKSAQNSTAVSIRTDVKGIALVKLLKPSYCPITLVKDIFQKIQSDKQPASKFTVRVIPLKYVFFPKESEFEENIEQIFHVELGIPITKKITEETSPSVGEKRSIADISTTEEVENSTVEELVVKQARTDAEIETTPVEEKHSSVTQPPVQRRIPYVIQFKARNHTVLTKTFVHEKIERLLWPYGYPDYRHAEVKIDSLFPCFPAFLLSLHRFISSAKLFQERKFLSP